MTIKGSKRLSQLGSAIFSEVADWKREVMNRGVDVIDLGIGSPDLPPSTRIIEAFTEAVQNPDHYGYPTSEGSLAFRTAVAKWYRYRFGVQLDPEHEILTLMGSQDGLAHLALSLCDPGDIAIVPDPGYPIYSASLVLAGVEPYLLPLRAEHNYLPQLVDIPVDVAAKARFILLNYPSNPLSAVADRAFFEQLIAYAKKHDLLVVHDLAYSEMAFDGYKPMSILEIEGAKEVAVEFHSLSKSFNMAGCRIAFLTGQADAVKALKTLKSNIDYGVWGAIQAAGIAALQEDMEHDHSVADVYQRRRDVFITALEDAGWKITPPKATMFIWAAIPKGWTSRQISREMLYHAGVVVIPGDAFGAEGEGFVRIALVQDEARLLEAARRIGDWLRTLE
ncbi:aminotransferase class I/II-fold pyridoxal phosphate-dependent enzyme [Paenibacillus sp. HWE-109]|uniref:aminotransferase class I/II-fold pyridoxal phosphate-dependent enzyme n=1 Tax=Paenibacillus sp. HWE-109 TaxID=1306526 RepID=UPI001EDE7BF5|nr:aminotransferase class I/II-fold pyridoxal phosphate-dependent enzyme [Paenibacillus sp. HWE-109]UKS24645.1 aminotransferase class I/II-fold pyridoxal phosphate-dependent enzyme [Paenibacillus sp. HWE-109]